MLQEFLKFLKPIEGGSFLESGGTLAVTTRVLWFKLLVIMDVPACFKTACTRDDAYASIDELKTAEKTFG
jgi:hypothetical protein